MNCTERDSAGAATGWLLGLWLLSCMSLWFFAFYEISADTPEWVQRAQAACFGSNESGLPGPSGWMLLVLSPALLLAAIFVALGKEARVFFASAARRPHGRRLGVLLGIAILLQASWVAASIRERVILARNNVYRARVDELPEAYPQGTSPAPEFSLLDQHGQTRTLAGFRGKPLILSFVFAHCRTVCPGIVQTLKSARDQEGVPIVFITLDPWRDTPAALPALAANWKLGEGEYMLSGSADAVNTALNDFHVARTRDEKNGDLAHPAMVYVIGADGSLAYTFNNPSLAWLREALRRLVK